MRELWWKRRFRQGADIDRQTIETLQARVVELENQLMTDERTGIPSNQCFFKHFEQHARPGDYVLFLDLDDFKSVNDFYGHELGDILLRKVAQGMALALDGHGLIARFGGDEFLAHVPAGPTDVEATIEKVMQAARFAEVGVGELRVSRNVSVGRAMVKPGMDVTEAAVAADRALLAAKRRGRNQSAELMEREASLLASRPSIEEVRLGLQRNEIGYHVQPIVDLASMQIEGYEALLRWQRPNGEVVGPAHFLDTMTSAYDDRTRPPLEAAHKTAAWAAQERDRFISFNLSTAFLNQIALKGPEWVRRIVGDVASDKIVFELVETIVDREADSVSEVVAALRATGVRVALDDFGTGRSTLERLQKIPVDIVKIDKHFLHMADRSQRDLEILKAMVDLTRSTEAICVVEGIETQSHLDLARDLGVDWVQGFLLGRPAPINAPLVPID
jgi:diguanylate cyclase (GGDEF)-like protein